MAWADSAGQCVRVVVRQTVSNKTANKILAEDTAGGGLRLGGAAGRFGRVFFGITVTFQSALMAKR